MKRRELLLASCAWALATGRAQAQQAKRIWRIGFPTTGRGTVPKAALEQGLRDLGYAPGKDVVVQLGSAAPEQLSRTLRGFVDAKVDVIVANFNPVVAAASAATKTIPIVMVAGTDVVRSGLVQSLASPGANVTGLTWDVGVEFVTKRLQLLKELAPQIARIGVLWEPPYEAQFRAPTDEAAAKLGLTVFWRRLSADVGNDFVAMADQHCNAFFPHIGPSLTAIRDRAVMLARERRWPSAFADSTSVDAGALMSYAPNYVVQVRSAARFVDRILKGANPADLPVEQPTVLEFVVNLKTAKALGLTIPRSILLRADRVIE